MNQDLLLAYGYGDGGGGVTREMLEMRRRLETMPGLPNVVTGRATDYFEALKGRIADTDQYVHTWDGELYLEIHRGTYTSQAYSKRTNRKLELSLRETEWLGVLSSLFQADWQVYPQAELREAWNILLRQQFHDILPGSSIHEVYEDSRVEYTEAESLVQEAWQQASGDTGAMDNAFTVFNSSSWDRTGHVRVRPSAGGEQGAWFDAADRELPAQRSGNDWIGSTIRAVNTGREDIVEGFSSVTLDGKQVRLIDLISQFPEEMVGEEHYEQYGPHTQVLVKLLDSAIRLHLQ